MAATRTWRFDLTTRIALVFLAAFMFAMAAILFSLPFVYGGGRSGDWTIALTGIVMTGFAIFATFGSIAATRTRVTLGATTLEATVVAGHNWCLAPQFREILLPLSEIHSVERRCEIFRTLGFLTMREALSVVTTRGQRVGLFSDTLGNAGTLPLDEVANAIAAAAGTPVRDDGTVRTKGSGLYGAASSSWGERPLDEVRARKGRRAAIATAQICSAILLLTLLLRAFL